MLKYLTTVFISREMVFRRHRTALAIWCAGVLYTRWPQK